MKSLLKRFVPKALHHFYNRLLSRPKIQRRLGDWFDAEWKHRARDADDRVWLETYERSWREHVNLDLTSLDLEKIAALISPDACVLDAGCGDGLLAHYLRDRCRRVIGLDLSLNALRRACPRVGQRGLFVQSFIEALPFASGTFDVVACTHTLEHVRDFEASVRELARVAARRLILLLPIQEYLPYTEDYHLNFFPDEQSLLSRLPFRSVKLERYQVPSGESMYGGEVFLVTIDLDRPSYIR